MSTGAARGWREQLTFLKQVRSHSCIKEEVFSHLHCGHHLQTILPISVISSYLTELPLWKENLRQQLKRDVHNYSCIVPISTIQFKNGHPHLLSKRLQRNRRSPPCFCVPSLFRLRQEPAQFPLLKINDVNILVHYPRTNGGLY